MLLSIAARWCLNCLEMDRTSYADADVVAVVANRFVPIRVDADRRPDVSLRYGLGGWPTTAFLTPDGKILGGGTYVRAGRLTQVLEQVYDAFAAGQHVQTGQAVQRPDQGIGPRTPVPPNPRTANRESRSPASTDQLVTQVNDRFDPVHGGFGDSPKFPHVAPVRLALELFREQGSQEARDVAVKSLDAMGWGPLYDEDNGGFFRCSEDADWGHPNQEKLLDVNAALLSLYVDAFEILQLARYAERAEDVLRYVQTWLADPVDGGWAGSQRADAPSSRRQRSGVMDPSDAPPVDRTLYSDWNGAMVSAALHAGHVMSDTGLSEFAIKSLERLVLLCYKPGGGVAHYFDGVARVRGLLDDQVAIASAQLDAFDVTGNIVYEMMAEELALFAIRTLWDESHGGFFDRVTDDQHDIGLLRERFKPFTANCAAAHMLRRLATASGNKAFAEHAACTLTAMSTRAAAEGLLAAEYLLAVRAAGEG